MPNTSNYELDNRQFEQAIPLLPLRSETSKIDAETNGGKIVEFAWNLISAKSEGDKRGASADAIAESAANVISMLPSNSPLLAGSTRALLLMKSENLMTNTTSELSNEAGNFLKGVAFNQLSRIGLKDISANTFSLRSVQNLAIMGGGIGAIQGLDKNNWRNKDNEFSSESIANGLKLTTQDAFFGSASAVAGGMLGKYGFDMGQKVLGPWLQSPMRNVLSLTASGYAAGFADGAVRGFQNGSDTFGILKDANSGGMLGAAIGMAGGTFLNFSKAASAEASLAPINKQHTSAWGITNRTIGADGEFLPKALGTDSRLHYYRLNNDGEIEHLSALRFLREVSSARQRAGGIIGYVPGIMQSPLEAIRDASVMGNASRLPSVTLDWASSAKSSAGALEAWSRIKSDLISSVGNQGWMNRSAEFLFHNKEGRKILVSHSQGAHLAIETAKDLAKIGSKLESLTLAHPHAVDLDSIAAIANQGTKVNVVSDPFDRALIASKYLLKFVAPEIKLALPNANTKWLPSKSLFDSPMFNPNIKFFRSKGEGAFRHSPDYSLLPKVFL